MESRFQIRNRTAGGAGHTLMELMVVMALLAIASALLLPITLKAYAGFKLRLTADSILRLMRQAKNRALFENRTYLVIFPEAAAQDRQIILAREDGATLSHFTLPRETVVASQTTAGDWSTEIVPIAFYPDGTSDSALLALKNLSKTGIRIQLDSFTAKAKLPLAAEAAP